MSKEWRALVGSLIAKRGRGCEQCGRRHDEDGNSVRIFGDHVKERKDGGADLDPANVKLLCGACHSKKTVEERVRRLRSP